MSSKYLLSKKIPKEKWTETRTGQFTEKEPKTARRQADPASDCTLRQPRGVFAVSSLLLEGVGGW